ncbi:MAG: alpha/beta fold hydrolase [Devosiaceae bacterium]
MSMNTSPPVANAAARHLSVLANDGITLAVEDAGPRHTNNHPLLCLAGLTRTKRDFYELRDHFAFHPTQPRRVVMMDARGRGRSQHDPDGKGYTVQREADDAASVATALGLHNTVIVGTSRGGILAMVLALTKPAMIAGSVLNDIGPRIAGAGLARLKRQLPSSGVPETWEEATARVRTAMAEQFTAFNEEDWARYARLTFEEKDGKPAPAFDPTLLAPLSALPDSLPFLDLSGPFAALASRPMLMLRGANSDLLDSDTMADAAHLGVHTHTIANQGHAPALRDGTLAPIERFLDEIDGNH